MTRAIALLASLLVAPAAIAWVPCEQKGLVPPAPIQREAPAYPQAVRAIGIEGTVEVALTVLRDGGVGWIRIVRADPRGYFEQAAAEGVRRWRFTPALQDGEPVECRMRTRVRFALTDAAATAAGDRDDRRPQPVYPPALLAARVEGYAEVEFDLADDGTVTNARLAAAMPRGDFGQAALAAVRAWRGPVGGAARHETRRFDFRLPDSELETVPATLLASAPFPMAACERRQSGRVVLEVETDAGGQVRAARILSSEPAGLFDQAALTIARGSRLSPAYRDGQPIPATALLTLPFAPERATCPNMKDPGREQRPTSRPPPRVTFCDEAPAIHDERPEGCARPGSRLSRGPA
jgi:TonB family protein